MSGSDWEALPDVREWSGGPPVCQGMVVRPYRMSGSGPDTLPDFRKDLPDVRKNLTDLREWSGGSPRSLGVIGSPSLMSGSGRESLPDVQELS